MRIRNTDNHETMAKIITRCERDTERWKPRNCWRDGVQVLSRQELEAAIRASMTQRFWGGSNPFIYRNPVRISPGMVFKLMVGRRSKPRFGRTMEDVTHIISSVSNVAAIRKKTWINITDFWSTSEAARSNLRVRHVWRRRSRDPGMAPQSVMWGEWEWIIKRDNESGSESKHPKRCGVGIMMIARDDIAKWKAGVQ